MRPRWPIGQLLRLKAHPHTCGLHSMLRIYSAQSLILQPMVVSLSMQPRSIKYSNYSSEPIYPNCEQQLTKMYYWFKIVNWGATTSYSLYCLLLSRVVSGEFCVGITTQGFSYKY